MSAPREIARYAFACTPPWWARGGHAQTIFGHLVANPAPSLARAERREISVSEGDVLVVRTLAGTSGVRVFLLHGLSGDADADYVRGAARALNAAGHAVWAVNLRGAGEGAACARHPYHSGSTADLAAVLAASRAEARADVHVVIGFSISGNIALLHAAQRRETRCDAVLAVNPPVDLARSADALHRGANRLYELRFVTRLRRAMRGYERRGAVRATGPIGVLDSLRTFDDRFTAPVSGFAGAADYYARCSSAPRLGEIGVPAVIVTSSDDPLVELAMVEGAARGSGVYLHVEEHGGHMGYLARVAPRHWLDGALVHYVSELARVVRSGAVRVG